MTKDQYLTEKVLEKCWHEGLHKTQKCAKCGAMAMFHVVGFAGPSGWEYRPSLNLTTPEGFFALWDAAQGKEWWTDFGESTMSAYEVDILSITRSWMQYIVNPLRFRDALYDFLKGRES